MTFILETDHPIDSDRFVNETEARDIWEKIEKKKYDEKVSFENAYEKEPEKEFVKVIEHKVYIKKEFHLANFKDMKLVNVKFIECNFSLTDFSGSKLRYCEFENCNITNSSFNNSDLGNCCFESELCNVSFRDAVLCSVSFPYLQVNSDFARTKFSRCSFLLCHNCNFNFAEFEVSNELTGQHTGSSFVHTDLSGVDCMLLNDTNILYKTKVYPENLNAFKLLNVDFRGFDVQKSLDKEYGY